MNQTDTFLKEIRGVLEGREDIAYAFLFGSALSHVLPGSDVDILVGADIDSIAKIKLTDELSRRLHRQADVVQTKDARCEVVLKAMSEGILVLVNDDKRLKEDYFWNFRAYDQTSNLRKIRIDRIKRQYAHG
jgi:predicted nucleotidyltransferase